MSHDIFGFLARVADDNVRLRCLESFARLTSRLDSGETAPRRGRGMSAKKWPLAAAELFCNGESHRLSTGDSYMAQRKKTVKITGYAEDVLRNNVAIDGNKLTITTELHRTDYVGVDKILKTLGGKWDRKAKAHVFPSDPRAVLNEALGNGEAVDKKKTLEQFDTPPELARRMVELAEIKRYDDVLEPSAGVGNLLDAVFEGSLPGRVKAIEIDLDRAEVLNTKFSSVEVWQGDFLEWPGEDEYLQDPFDVVLMNPPFSNNQDIDHVLHAWEFLRPGGRIVAVISPHSAFADEEACLKFRYWLNDIGAEISMIEEGTFADSGTKIRAQLVVAVKAEMEVFQPRQPVYKQSKRPEPLPLFVRFGLE